MTSNDVVERRSIAAIGNMNQVDGGSLRHQSASQVRGRARALRGILELTGIRTRSVDQGLQRCGRKIRVSNQHVRRDDGEGNGRQSFIRIEGHRLVQVSVCREYPW